MTRRALLAAVEAAIEASPAKHRYVVRRQFERQVSVFWLILDGDADEARRLAAATWLSGYRVHRKQDPHLNRRGVR